MNERLSTQDLVDLLAEKHGMSKKDADGFVREFFLLIEQALESDRCVKVKGLGTFKLVDVDSRESVKVNTGERFQIQGHTKVSFTPEPSLRDLINKPFAHFETVLLNDNTVLEDTPVEEEQEEEIDETVGSVEAPSLEETVDKEESTENEELVENEEQVENEEPIEDEDSVDPQEPTAWNEPDEVAVATVEEAPDPLIEVVQTEESEPLFSAESIIAAELRKAEQEFGAPRMDTNQAEQLPPLPPQKPLPDRGEKEKSATPYLVAIILLVLLLCGGALTFVYYPDLFSSAEPPKEIQAPSPQPVAEQESLLDTLTATQDTVAEVASKAPNATPTIPLKEASKAVQAEPSTPAKAATPVKPDSVNYKISGTKTTHTVKTGETLTRISLHYYGVKDLWPYIVQHNRDVIKNPDNVPYGTIIKIPELVKK